MDVDSSGAYDRSRHGVGLAASGLGYLGYFGQLGVFCIFKSNVYPVVVDVVVDFGGFIPDWRLGLRRDRQANGRAG